MLRRRRAARMRFERAARSATAPTPRGAGQRKRGTSRCRRPCRRHDRHELADRHPSEEDDGDHDKDGVELRCQERCSVSRSATVDDGLIVPRCDSPDVLPDAVKDDDHALHRKPMTVRAAVRNSESTSQSATSPRTLAMPSSTRTSWSILIDGADAVAQGVGYVAIGKGDECQDGGRRRQDGQSSGARRLATDGGADTFKAQPVAAPKRSSSVATMASLASTSMAWRG